MKLTTERLKRLIREELEKTIKEYRTKDDLEQMNGKVFIDKLTAQAQKLKSPDKRMFPENLKARAKIAEAFLSIAKTKEFKNSYEGSMWMRDNAVGIIEKRLPEEVFRYANPGSILDTMLKF